jgi:hypothetical protein
MQIKAMLRSCQLPDKMAKLRTAELSAHKDAKWLEPPTVRGSEVGRRGRHGGKLKLKTVM